MSKGNTPRTLWEIMINTPDALQLCSSSVHFTIKFYKASRHPAGCIHCEMASSTMVFCSVSVALCYSLPHLHSPSLISYEGLHIMVFLDAVGSRREFYFWMWEKEYSLNRNEVQIAVNCIKEHAISKYCPSIFESVFAGDCNFPLKWLSLDFETFIYMAKPQHASNGFSPPVSLHWDLRYPESQE